MISYNKVHMTITLREDKQMLPDITGKALENLICEVILLSKTKQNFCVKKSESEKAVVILISRALRTDTQLHLKGIYLQRNLTLIQKETSSCT